MQEEFAMVSKLTFDTNTIYTVIYWAKIVFSLCLQRDLNGFKSLSIKLSRYILMHTNILSIKRYYYSLMTI